MDHSVIGPAYLSPNGDGMMDRTPVHIKATNSWKLEIKGRGLIQRGSGNIDFTWTGKTQNGKLPDSSYTMVLTDTKTGEIRQVPVIIDTQKPQVSDLKIKLDQSDTTGNSFIVTGKVVDIGPAGIDRKKVRVDIKGIAITDAGGLEFPTTDTFSMRFRAQRKARALISADVTATDNAGNNVTQSSDSEKLKRLKKTLDQFQTSLLNTDSYLASQCPTNAVGYHLSAEETDLAVIRRVYGYTAADLLTSGTLTNEQWIAVFIFYCTIHNIPVDEEELKTDTKAVIIGFATGAIEIRGAVYLLEAVRDLLPGVCTLLRRSASSLTFKLSNWRGTLSLEKDALIAVDDKLLIQEFNTLERTFVENFLEGGLNVTVKKSEKINEVRSGVLKAVDYRVFDVNGVKVFLEKGNKLTEEELDAMSYIIKKNGVKPSIPVIKDIKSVKPNVFRGSTRPTPDFKFNEIITELKSINRTATNPAQRIRSDMRTAADQGAIQMVIDARANAGATKEVVLKAIDLQLKNGNPKKLRAIRIFGGDESAGTAYDEWIPVP